MTGAAQPGQESAPSPAARRADPQTTPRVHTSLPTRSAVETHFGLVLDLPEPVYLATLAQRHRVDWIEPEPGQPPG